MNAGVKLGTPHRTYAEERGLKISEKTSDVRAHKHKDIRSAKNHSKTRWRTKMKLFLVDCLVLGLVLTSPLLNGENCDISIRIRRTNMSVLLVLMLMVMSLVFSLAYAYASFSSPEPLGPLSRRRLARGAYAYSYAYDFV